MQTRDPPLIPAVNRALNILEFVAQERVPVTIKDIATSLQIPNTTAFRMVKQLQSRGYLEESDQQPGTYHLGLQVFVLFNGMTYINNLRQVSHVELDRLASESHQAVQMGILKGCNVTYVEQILPPNPVLIYTTPYTELPLNVSAGGKVLAAYSSPAELDRLLSQAQFKKQTPKTIDSVDQFRAQLKQIRAVGYAEDDEEFALGIGCLAAPVFNHEMKCVAAVGITGTIQDYQGDSRQRLTELLLHSARTLSLKMGMPSKN